MEGGVYYRGPFNNKFKLLRELSGEEGCLLDYLL